MEYNDSESESHSPQPDADLTWQEHLIELVRARPCLYDKANRSYFDKDVKANNWSDVTTQLKDAGYTYLKDSAISVDVVITKWNSLRDGLKKANNKIDDATKSGAKGGKKPAPYIYHQQMDFMRSVNKKRRTVTNQANEDPSRPASAPASQSVSVENSSRPTSVESSSRPTSVERSSRPTSVESSARPASVESSARPSSAPPPLSSPSSSTQSTPSTSQQQKAKKRKAPDFDIANKLEAQIDNAGKIFNQFTQEDENDRFGRVVADMMREIRDSYAKDGLKLDIQQRIMAVKHNNNTDTANTANAANAAPQNFSAPSQSLPPQDFNFSSYTSFLNY